MTQENQSIQQSTNFVEVNGTGTVPTTYLRGSIYRDVTAYGYFERYGYYFTAMASVVDPTLFRVCEASTGYAVEVHNYYTLEDSLYAAISKIDENRTKLATVIGNARVVTQTNLLTRNTTLLQTLAIDTIFML